MNDKTENRINLLSSSITILTAIFTILQAILGVDINASSKFNIIIDFSAWSDKLQNSDPVIKFITFFILEAANAYFFGTIFNWLHKRFKGELHDLLLLLVVNVLTASISILFVKTIIFNNTIGSSLGLIGVTFFYLISLGITLYFFSYKHAIDKTESEKGSIDEFLGKISGVIKPSIIFLVVLYIFFYLMVLFYYFFG